LKELAADRFACGTLEIPLSKPDLRLFKRVFEILDDLLYFHRSIKTQPSFVFICFERIRFRSGLAATREPDAAVPAESVP